MDAHAPLEAVACDGYRSTCRRGRICDRLPGTLWVGGLVCFDGFLFFRVSHVRKIVRRALRRLTQEGQLWSSIYRQLLGGFKRGLLCRLRKLLAECKALRVFLCSHVQ